MRILGIDPGLQKPGWGVIDAVDNRLSFVASGVIRTPASGQMSLAARLALIDVGLSKVVDLYKPDMAAVEETFVNKNPAAALKLGQARGVALVVPARMGLEVGEYSPNRIKKAVVGAGKAGKDQVGMMIRILLPACGDIGEDEADALAVAICHAHHVQSAAQMGQQKVGRVG